MFYTSLLSLNALKRACIPVQLEYDVVREIFNSTRMAAGPRSQGIVLTWLTLLLRVVTAASSHGDLLSQTQPQHGAQSLLGGVWRMACVQKCEKEREE